MASLCESLWTAVIFVTCVVPLEALANLDNIPIQYQIDCGHLNTCDGRSQYCLRTFASCHSCATDCGDDQMRSTHSAQQCQTDCQLYFEYKREHEVTTVRPTTHIAVSKLIKTLSTSPPGDRSGGLSKVDIALFTSLGTLGVILIGVIVYLIKRRISGQKKEVDEHEIQPLRQVNTAATQPAAGGPPPAEDAQITMTSGVSTDSVHLALPVSGASSSDEHGGARRERTESESSYIMTPEGRTRCPRSHSPTQETGAVCSSQNTGLWSPGHGD